MLCGEVVAVLRHADGRVATKRDACNVYYCACTLLRSCLPIFNADEYNYSLALALTRKNDNDDSLLLERMCIHLSRLYCLGLLDCNINKSRIEDGEISWVKRQQETTLAAVDVDCWSLVIKADN